MSYTVLTGERSSRRPAVVELRLVELLSRREVAAIEAGDLVAEALTEGQPAGHLLALEGRVPLGSTLRLRPPNPPVDLRGFGVPVNEAGEICSLAEAERIRAAEIAAKTSFSTLSLGEIRARLARLEHLARPELPADSPPRPSFAQRCPSLARRRAEADVQRFRDQLQAGSPLLAA